MYYIYIESMYKELKEEIEGIKKEIEAYLNINYGEEVKLDYNIIEDCSDEFCACVDENNDVRFDLKYISNGYRCLFDRVFNINPNNDIILKDVMRILLNCILVHESHHFYYKKYRTEVYSNLKEKDNNQTFRKYKDLEVLADNFMVNFMGRKGDLYFMIAGLAEKCNQEKNDRYTKCERINDIVAEVKKNILN